MAYGTRVNFEELRSLAFGGIGVNYAACGSATTHRARIITFFNQTDKEVFISLDGVTTQISLPSGVGHVLDLTANKVRDDGLFIKDGTIFYVKQGSAGAPASGKVTIQVLYGDGGI
jgi:hypothetical protein